MRPARLLVADGKTPTTAAELAASIKRDASYVYKRVADRDPIDGVLWTWGKNGNRPAYKFDAAAVPRYVCRCPQCEGKARTARELLEEFPRELYGVAINPAVVGELSKRIGHLLTVVMPTPAQYNWRGNGAPVDWLPVGIDVRKRLPKPDPLEWTPRIVGTDPAVIENLMPLNTKGPGILTAPWGIPPFYAPA